MTSPAHLEAQTTSDDSIVWDLLNPSLQAQVPKECGPTCVFDLKPCSECECFPRRVECREHGYLRIPRRGMDISKARIESKEVERMLLDWHDDLIPWMPQELAVPDPRWHFAYNLAPVLKSVAAISLLPIEEIVNDGRILIAVPSRGWVWDEIAEGLFREGIYWDPSGDSLQWLPQQKPAYELRPFYCRAKANPLIDLPLRVVVPDRELKTAAHNHYCRYPKPAPFCDLQPHRAACPVLTTCDGRTRVPDSCGGFVVADTRNFDRRAADEASERIYKSLPLRTISFGTFSTNCRSLKNWITKGHTDNDPNLAYPERMSTDIVRGSGGFISQSTTASVRWNYAHDKMLEDVSRTNGTDVVSASEDEIKFQLAEHKRSIDEAAARIKKLRDDYAASMCEKLDFSSAREVASCQTNMPSTRCFKSVVGAFNLNLILPSNNVVSGATEVLWEGKLNAALRADSDKARLDALERLPDVVAEAVGVEPDDLLKQKWEGFYDEIVRPGNSQKQLADLKNEFPLPASASETWLEHLRRYIGVLIPTKSRLFKEIDNVKLRGYARGRQYIVDTRDTQRDDIAEYTERAVSSFAHAFGNDDESVESLTHNDILNVYRETTIITNRSELLDKFKSKFEAGTLTREDALIYATKLENIKMESNRLVEQEQKTNTLVQRSVRALKKMNEDAIASVCSCGIDGCEFESHKRLAVLLDDLNAKHPEVDIEMFATGGVFVAFVKLDRERLYHLDVQKFTSPSDPTSGWHSGKTRTGSPLNVALLDLYHRILKEAVRKRSSESYRAIKGTIKMSDWEQHAAEECRRITDAFVLGSCYLVRPDPVQIDPASESTTVRFSRVK